MMSRTRLPAIAVGIAVALPVQAQAAILTPTIVFMDASPSMKVVMLGLLVATLAAIIVGVRKVLAGPNLSGGSAFVSALRLGGPLLGLLGGAYTGLMMFMGLARRGAQPIEVLAPGLAEIAMLVLLGLLAGVVAVASHWAIEARIDRTVLSR